MGHVGHPTVEVGHLAVKHGTGTKDAGWWASEVGQEYIAANRLAHQTQGKEIRRVFILDDDPDSRSGLVDAAIAANADAGVRVRVIDKSELRQESTQHLLINMTAFGRQFVHRDINNECGETVEYLYSTVHADVSRLTALFDELWVRAHDFVPQS